MGLSAGEVQFYQQKGLSRQLMLNSQEAVSSHTELQSIETRYGAELVELSRNNIHQEIPFVDE